MSGIKSLRTLVRLKTRRIDQHDQALQDAKAQLVRAEEATATARSQEAEVREAEQAVAGRLEATTANIEGFDSRDVITLQMLLKEAEQHTAQAAHATQQALAQEEQAQQQRSGCERELKRAEDQLEALQQRLQDALMAADQAQEEAQDEEAEETAVARMLARRRSVERAQRHSLGAQP
jgi:hypothetical protein